MSVHIAFSEDAAWALQRARPLLVRDPVRNNLILSLLTARVARPEPGRYWIAERRQEVVGLVFQSPLNQRALLTEMNGELAALLADTVASSRFAIPGCMGEAATAARFAGQWSERTKVAATPIEGLRLYEASTVAKQAAPGNLRKADVRDRQLLVGWMKDFMTDVVHAIGDPEVIVDARLGRGQFWIWENDRPVSLLGLNQPVESVVRVGPVYTPPENRNRGYAGAIVSETSDQILSAGKRPILYTQLHNPTSNSIYRRIGYTAVAESVAYRFGDGS